MSFDSNPSPRRRAAPSKVQHTRFLRCLAVSLLIAAFALVPAHAAGVPGLTTSSADGTGTVEIPTDLTAAEREELLARLSDEQVRELILQVWQQAVPAAQEGDGATDDLMENAELFQTNFRASLGAFPDLPSVVPLFFSSMIPRAKAGCIFYCWSWASPSYSRSDSGLATSSGEAPRGRAPDLPPISAKPSRPGCSASLCSGCSAWGCCRFRCRRDTRVLRSPRRARTGSPAGAVLGGRHLRLSRRRGNPGFSVLTQRCASESTADQRQ